MKNSPAVFFNSALVLSGLCAGMNCRADIVAKFLTVFLGIWAVGSFTMAAAHLIANAIKEKK